jgi:hypothetical protein
VPPGLTSGLAPSHITLGGAVLQQQQLQPTMKVQSAPVAQSPAASQLMTPAELDALIARYAAAAPPGTRAREQAARVQDVGSLRLSSAPGSMQIRIAGLPVVPMSPQSGMQTPQPGLPPFHRQQQAAAVEQQQQQQQQDAVFQPLQAATHPGGSEDLTPMDAAAAEPLDMDQMADLLDAFVADGAHFAEL